MRRASYISRIGVSSAELFPHDEVIADIIFSGSERYHYTRRRKHCESRGLCKRFETYEWRAFQDSVSVENALYRDPRILEAAAVGIPDERLGELVAAVVSVKSAYQGSVNEASLIGLARKQYDSSVCHMDPR